MTNPVYYLLCAICVVAVLFGINLMSKVKCSVGGNALSAVAMVMAIAIIYFTRAGATTAGVIIALAVAMAIGAAVGIYGAVKAKMIAMPQIIAMLNGLGGAASALVAAVTAVNGAASVFDGITAGLALAIGALTFTGSLIAAGKLARILDSRPKSLPGHTTIMAMLVVYCLKGISFTKEPFGLPELISVALVAVLHVWKRNTLFSIICGTVCYMVLIQFIF